MNTDFYEEIWYNICNEKSYEEKTVSDANPQKGTISDASPIGKAILEHMEGDEIIVSLPTGVQKKYRIIKIE